MELEFISCAEVESNEHLVLSYLEEFESTLGLVFSKKRVAYVVRRSIEFSETFKCLFTYVYKTR